MTAPRPNEPQRPGFSPEEMKARRRRSLWTALALVGFIVLVFVITLTKLGANILVRDL